jgi:hypothetical protein
METTTLSVAATLLASPVEGVTAVWSEADFMGVMLHSGAVQL